MYRLNTFSYDDHDVHYKEIKLTLEQKYLNAVRDGNLKSCIECLQSGAIDINVRGEFGCTALLLACYKGHLHIVKHFIQNYTSISTTTTTIKNRIDINAQTILGHNAYDIAIAFGHKKIAKYLASHTNILLPPKKQ